MTEFDQVIARFYPWGVERMLLADMGIRKASDEMCEQVRAFLDGLI